MKKPVFLIPAAAILCLASCAKDGETIAKKKSVSVGRFGVRQVAVDTPAEVPVAPEAAVADAAKKQQQSQSKPSGATPSEPDLTPSYPAPRRSSGGRDEGVRLPGDFLKMPENRDMKATNPTTKPSEGDGGGVISRPPVEKKDKE